LTRSSKLIQPTPDPAGLPEGLDGVPPDSIPRHIAMIMDGNGRWAQRQGKLRVEGHLRGAETVRKMTDACARIGVRQLTLFCLSSENWKRPAEELDFLMQLLRQYLSQEQGELVRNNIRLSVIGRLEELPDDVRTGIEQTVASCESHTGIRLCLAINYGSRREIIDAAREIARKVQIGELSIGGIDEQVFSDHLYTAGMPDPDLLIRTAGEMRISNYLLWQISYSELWVTEKMWPEMGVDDLYQAIRDYSRRERRYGGLKTPENC